MTLNKMPTAIIAVLGIALSVAAVFLLLPAGVLWATQNADARVIAVRNLGDLPSTRILRLTQVLNVDPKHRSARPIFKP